MNEGQFKPQQNRFLNNNYTGVSGDTIDTLKSDKKKEKGKVLSYTPDVHHKREIEDDKLKQKESLIFKSVIDENNGELKVDNKVDLTNQLLEKNSELAQALRAGDIKQAKIIKIEIVNIKQAIEDLQNIH